MSDNKRLIENKFDLVADEAARIMTNTVYKYILSQDEYKKSIKTKQDVINDFIPEIMNNINIFFEKGIWSIILNYIEQETIVEFGDEIDNLIEIYETSSAFRSSVGNKYRFPINYSFYGINYGVKFIYYKIKIHVNVSPIDNWYYKNGIGLTIIYKKNGKCDIIECISSGYSNCRYEIATDVDDCIRYNEGMENFSSRKTGYVIFFKKFEI